MDVSDPTTVDFGLSFYQGESGHMLDAAFELLRRDGTFYDLVLEQVTPGGTAN
jgi:hypothetical protein